MSAMSLEAVVCAGNCGAAGNAAEDVGLNANIIVPKTALAPTRTRAE